MRNTTHMMLFYIFSIFLYFPLINCATEDSINLLVRSSVNSTVRRYCIELAALPNGHVIDIPAFGWHQPYLASSSVNACNISSLAEYLPASFPDRTLLILTEHQCKITEHAWHVEQRYKENISLMILTNRTNVHYELTYNTTAMPVAIPVLIFWLNDFYRVNQTYGNINELQMSISYPLVMPKKFRPSILLMFVLVFLILLGGNLWAADEFVRKIQKHHKYTRNLSTNSNATTTTTTIQQPDSPINNNGQSTALATTTTTENTNNQRTKSTSSNNDPAFFSIHCCSIILLLVFAVGWLLLIYYFPKVMIYVLQVMFCIGAFSSMSTCFVRLSYFVPRIRRFSIPSHSCQKPCKCTLGPLNVCTLCAMILSLTLVIVWYINRQADWAWILQDILGAAVCLTVISVYRLGNMRVITLILLGFFLYDVFFVFITPYIPFFQPSTQPTTTAVSTTAQVPFGVPITQIIGIRKLTRNPSVMEQVALGIGTDGEVVPLLFVLPMFIPESEVDPCLTARRSMLGFGDVILPVN